MSVSNPVIWFEIYVDDMKRAVSFYETVFDLKMEELPVPPLSDLEMWFFPNDMNSSNKASGSLVKTAQMKAGGNSTVVYFSSKDCAIEEARVESAGGKIMRPKVSIGDFGFISLVLDTEGNLIGIHSLV